MQLGLWRSFSLPLLISTECDSVANQRGWPWRLEKCIQIKLNYEVALENWGQRWIPLIFFFSSLAAVCPYKWGLIWNPNSVKVVQQETSRSFEEQKPLCQRILPVLISLRYFFSVIQRCIWTFRFIVSCCWKAAILGFSLTFINYLKVLLCKLYMTNVF